MSQFGPAYDERIDGERLRTQQNKIRDWMIGSNCYARWFSLKEISDTLGFPEASVSAQMRHLRGQGFQLSKRRRNGKGTWEYLLMPPLPKAEQMRLIR